MFSASEGYDVIEETTCDNTVADLSTSRISRRPGGICCRYDFMLTESKKSGKPRGATEDHLYDHLAGNVDDTKIAME